MCARPPLPFRFSCYGCGVVAVVVFFYWIVSLSSKRLSSVAAIYLFIVINFRESNGPFFLLLSVRCHVFSPHSLCALNDNFKWNRITIYIVFSLMAIGHGWRWKRKNFNSQPQQIAIRGRMLQSSHLCASGWNLFESLLFFTNRVNGHVNLHETLNYHIERSFDGQR